MPDALARELLRGAISYHDHYGWQRGGGGSGAETRCRATYDSVEIVQAAAAAGMRAVVLRNLYFSSAGDAHLVKLLVPGIDVIGGLFLNAEVGGLNPIAVETAMTYAGGARFVCLATDSSANIARDKGCSELEIRSDPVRYVTPFAEDGTVKPEMLAILALIAEYDMLFETGILRPAEILTVLRAARSAGVRRMVVTHPQPWYCAMSIEEMRQAVDLGALIEFTWLFYGHSVSYQARRYGVAGVDDPPVEHVGTAFDQIKALGAKNCILSTDYGTLQLPLPSEGLREFVFCLLDCGMTADEVSLMIRDNPARVLGLS